MFGFVTPNECDLSDKEMNRYRQVYCGVCRSLRNRSGQLSRLTLNHDLAFVALLLTSLYEPREETGEMACPAHPVKKRAYAVSEYTDYAADMTVVMAYHKLMDNWVDDRSVASRAFAQALKGAYLRVKERFPRQCAACEEGLARIAQIEAAGCAHVAADDAEGCERCERAAADALVSSEAVDSASAVDSATDESTAGFVAGSAGVLDAASPAGPDAAAREFGLVMAEVMVVHDDAWAGQLHAFGYELGRFIYMMDAAFDAADDAETGSFNPFTGASLEKDDVRLLLEGYMARAVDVFERLPLVKDIRILRSVLYAGVWKRLNAQQNEACDGCELEDASDNMAPAGVLREEA